VAAYFQKAESVNGSSISVSVIVCAYTRERWKDLCEAVTSARNQVPPPGEIIVVVDHNPELKDRCDAEFPDAIVIENRYAPGLSGARNSGIAIARGLVVAFLDDDAIADRHWTSRLLAQCERPGIAGATAKVVPLWIGHRPAWLPEEFLWVVGCSYRGLPSEAREIRNLTGGACCIKREVFARVGGFDSRLGRGKGKLPLSCEETELCIRARGLIGSIRFMFEPDAVIFHKVSAQRLTWRYFGLRCYAEGLSKAYLTTLIAPQGVVLSSERSYVLRTLSAGLVRGLGDTLLRFDRGGLARMVAIIFGLSCAVTGFAVGKISAGFERGRLSPRLQGEGGRAPAAKFVDRGLR
jgi:GT2 family glycosyltransferase